MSTIVETENGLSYDFGVQIATGVVQGIAQGVVGAVSLVGAMYALIHATTEMDDRLNRNMVAFGGYANTLKAIAYTSDKIASGVASAFDQDDLIAGMRELQRAGLNAKTNFDLVAKAAEATGSTYTNVASAIRSGNVNALAEMGIITDRTARSVENMGLTQQQSMKVVLGYLSQAEKKGMFDGTVKTFPAILARFKEFGKELMKAVLGDPKDPEGFAFTVKRQLSEIADFFYRNLDTIRKVGALIGRILKFIAEVSYDFMRGVWSIVKGVGKSIESFFGNFWEKMMSFGLYLEILRVQIKSFFTEYGDEIKKVILIAGALYALSYFGNLLLEGHAAIKMMGGIKGLLTAIGESSAFTSLTGSLATFARGLAAIPAFLTAMVVSIADFVALLSAGIPVAEAFSLVLAANPIGVIVLAAGALLATGYLIYKNWDDVKKIFLWLYDILTTVVPLFAVIRMVAEAVYNNWDKIKTVFMQVWEIVKNVAKIMYYGVLSAVRDVKNFFVNIFDSVVKILSKITIFKTVFEGIKSVVTFIHDIFGKFSDAVGWVLDKVSAVLGKGVTYTADAAANAQAQYNGTPTGGTPATVTAPTGSSNPTPATTTPVGPSPSSTTNSTTVSGGGMVVQPGAIVINGANYDEAKLASVIEQVLYKIQAKNNSRTGKNNKNEF